MSLVSLLLMYDIRGTVWYVYGDSSIIQELGSGCRVVIVPHSNKPSAQSTAYNLK
jgi:hypothetical protein